MFAPEVSYYKDAHTSLQKLDPEELANLTEQVANLAFSIDGRSSRELMPYPHDPLREPAPWKDYDHLTIRQRLEMLDIEKKQKDLFETIMSSLGSASGSEIGWTEALRWYALAGHSLARIWEAAGVYKLGKGGTTSLAMALLNDCSSDVAFGTRIEKIEQNSGLVILTSSTGDTFKARHVVCTIPL